MVAYIVFGTEILSAFFLRIHRELVVCVELYVLFYTLCGAKRIYLSSIKKHF